MLVGRTMWVSTKRPRRGQGARAPRLRCAGRPAQVCARAVNVTDPAFVIWRRGAAPAGRAARGGTMRRTMTFGGAAAGLALALLAACQEPPRVGPRAGTTAQAPGARIRLDTATVNATDRIVVTFHATKDD